MAPPRTILAAIAFEPSGDGVERSAASGPGSAPTAFRIWRPGINVTDIGNHDFTDESARAILERQTARGLRTSIDVDHLSLNESSPPESRKAVGWHDLAVRQGAGGPELWAVNVEWTDAVRSGLESDPPEWRYFSPAYRLAKDSNEIAVYVNTALTNNPATHHVTALASLGDRTMPEEKKPEAELEDMTVEDALAAFMGDDEPKKEGAKKWMHAMAAKAAMADARAAGEGGEKPEGEDDTGKKATKTSEEKPGEKPEKPEEATVGKLVTIVSSLAKSVQGVIARLDTRDADEKKTADASKRAALMAKRPDLTDAMRGTLSYVPTEKLETELAKYPRARSIVLASVRANTSAGGDVAGGERTDTDATNYRPMAAEETVLFDRTSPFRRKAGEVRANISGGEMVMPSRIITADESRARVAELEKELGIA